MITLHTEWKPIHWNGINLPRSEKVNWVGIFATFPTLRIASNQCCFRNRISKGLIGIWASIELIELSPDMSNYNHNFIPQLKCKPFPKTYSNYLRLTTGKHRNYRIEKFPAELSMFASKQPLPALVVVCLSFAPIPAHQLQTCELFPDNESMFIANRK